MDRRPDLAPQIVARVTAGDEPATLRFVQHYEQYVHDVIGHVLGLASPDIDDVAQETFWAAITALRRKAFDPYGRGSTKAWLGKIAQRRAFNFLRSRRRRGPSVPLDEHLVDRLLRDDELQPLDVLERRERIFSFYEAMSRLPLTFRTVVIGRLDDQSDEDMALQARVSQITIRTRHRRALSLLRAEVAVNMSRLFQSKSGEMESGSFENLIPVCESHDFDIIVVSACTHGRGTRR
ncbi:MAG: sigma-70 family RNA polymerase sigma factor [Rhodoglobus sp.]|nr:sigma-70 family RNA polymerase sigma factor [Rhodoglobus sp.]